MTATWPRARLWALLAVGVAAFPLAAVTPARAQNPVPVLSSVSPPSLPIGTFGAFGASITLFGSNFVSASVVRLDNTTLATTFVSSTQLTAQIVGSYNGGTARVVNPAPGGGTSNGVVVGVILGGPGSTFPTISVPPGLVRFEMALVGAYQEARLQVANALSGVLNGVVSASPPFSCVSGCAYSLAGGAIQDVIIRFTPVSTGTVQRVVSFSGGAGAVTPVEASAALAPPTTRVTLNGTQFRTGQTLTVGIEAHNPAGNPALRLYVGIVLPDGDTVAVLSSQGALLGTGRLSVPSSLPLGESAPASFTLAAPTFFRFTFPPTGVLPGTYVIFAALARDGAFTDNQIGPGDVVAIDGHALSFSP